MKNFCKTIFIIVYILPFVASIIFFIISICKPYEPGEKYIEAVKKTWKNKPIFDISTTEKEGYEKYSLFNQENFDPFCDCSFVEHYWKCHSGKCSEIDLNDSCIEYSKTKCFSYKNKTLYIKYYDADYITLFSRVHDEYEKYFGLCKSGYKRCGFLDIFKNPFCVKKDENCPINYINISSDIFTYKGINYFTINQLYVSEKENATIFNIDEIFTQKNIRDLEKEIKENKIKKYTYFYNLSYTNDFIIKSDFAKENNLISVGKIPEYFYNTKLYLYHLVYPGNLKNHKIDFDSIESINSYNSKKLLFLFFKIIIMLFPFISIYICSIEKCKIKYIYQLIILIPLSIIIILLYIFLVSLSTIKYHNIINDIYNILIYYEENIYNTNENDYGFIKILRNTDKIIVIIIEILIFLFFIIYMVYICYTLKNKNQNNFKSEEEKKPIRISNNSIRVDNNSLDEILINNDTEISE